MQVFIPEKVRIVELESAPFKNVKSATEWVRSHGIIGLMSDVDTGNKGEISISVGSIDKMLSGSALHKSVTAGLHYAALSRLRDIIRESFVAEMHPDYLKVNGRRTSNNPINPNVLIAVLYGCVELGGFAYRAKTTLKLFVDPNEKTKAYAYEISNIEILRGTAGYMTQPNCKTSMLTRILRHGVSDVNGIPLVSEC